MIKQDLYFNLIWLFGANISFTHILKWFLDVALEADVSLPNYTENDNYGTQISKDEDSVSTPGNNRCGKKTMFPMVFAYEEAKSPRSPLGQMNLNSKFLVRSQ